jgi:hypothetical protein
MPAIIASAAAAKRAAYIAYTKRYAGDIERIPGLPSIASYPAAWPAALPGRPSGGHSFEEAAMRSSNTTPRWSSGAIAVTGAAAALVALAFGLRAVLGIFLRPLNTATAWALRP